ncbi:MAG: TonB-dependent receptor domain-containing protein, partial [Acidimicrobiales bacterium]
ILGLAVDTYTVSVQFQGFEPLATSGVTIIGDQDVNIGTLHLSKELVTIGRVTSRSVASAFQPNQTVDSVTISGARILQTTGRAGSTDEKALLLAAPGVTQTNGGSISIRGGLSTEVGYQFDGVPYTDPFQTLPATTAASVFSNAFNPSNVGSPLLFSGLSSVQVVEGAGDATQGNVGGGVVNLVPKRGTYPGFGSIDAAIGGPNFDHQLLLQYGFASANGRFSDYISFDGARDVPYLGYSNNELAGLGYFYTPSGVSEQTNDDLINNFVFKFGHNNDQSLQILYQSRQAQQYGFAGGLAGQVAYPFDPASYLNGQATSSIDKLATGYGCTGASGSSTCPYGPGIGMPAAIAEYQKLVGLTPNVPNTTNGAYTSPTLFQVNNTNYLKFEYDNSLTPNDYLAVRYYNWATNNVSNLDLPLSAGNAQPGSAPAGGSRAGMSGEFTHLFGTKHTFTFGFGYENQLPQYSVAFPTWAFADLSGAFAGPPGQGVPSFADFLQPVNGVCPIIGGCYLANYFPNGTPRVPLGGINYHGANFNAYNASLRDQWAPNSRLKFDYGLRLDGMAYNIKPNPVNAGLPFYSSDPTDVPTAGLNPQYYDPKALEPRLAVSYQMGANDAVRAGYGRSVIFLNAATFGTPAALYNAAPFENVPALDSAQNPQCGNSAGPGGVVKCLNYAQQLFWAIDNNFDYPDLGNATRYAVYNNYDFTYQHQFHNGWGLRLTPFYKLASDLPGVSVISLQTNPTTGEILSETFGTNNLNHNKT